MGKKFLNTGNVLMYKCSNFTYFTFTQSIVTMLGDHLFNFTLFV